jgi:hypothetical protein
MAQHGQVLKLRSCRSDGKARWAYRYRVNGSCSKRPQVGGFATREEAERALKRELARFRPGREITLTELVEEYLRIHQAAPSTLEKLGRVRRGDRAAAGRAGGARAGLRSRTSATLSRAEPSWKPANVRRLRSTVGDPVPIADPMPDPTAHAATDGAEARRDLRRPRLPGEHS